jgi:DNA recombination protein RmuC
MVVYLVSAALGGSLLGALVLWLLLYRSCSSARLQVEALKAHNDELKEETIGLRQERIRLERENGELSTRLESLKERYEQLDSSRDLMKKEFENLSRQIYEGASDRLARESRTALSSLLDPFKQQIREFKQRVEYVYDTEAKDRRGLYEQIKTLKDLNVQINEEAANLTRALKGDTKKQGTWGELVLSTILEQSGLREGLEYEQQRSFTDEGGSVKRPDVIVHLPEKKDIIVDSKVSLSAYEEYVSSDDPQSAEQALARHITSLKKHIKELSEKSYEDLAGINCLDYVLMFIPIESAFITAVETERSLFNEAYRKNIILVSPSTLLVTLRTIGNIWRYERQNTHAQEIAERAGKLYDKFAGFMESLEDVGSNLEKSQHSLNQAMNRLTTGRGNLLSQVESIRKLGARNRKQIGTAADDGDST